MGRCCNAVNPACTSAGNPTHHVASRRTAFDRRIQLNGPTTNTSSVSGGTLTSRLPGQNSSDLPTAGCPSTNDGPGSEPTRIKWAVPRRHTGGDHEVPECCQPAGNAVTAHDDVDR